MSPIKSISSIPSNFFGWLGKVTNGTNELKGEDELKYDRFKDDCKSEFFERAKFSEATFSSYNFESRYELDSWDILDG